MTLPPTPPAPALARPTSPSEMRDSELQIYCLDIRQFSASHCAHAAELMSSAERERAAKFIRGKEMYIASRWLLRTTLSRYTGIPAPLMEFALTDKGKPFIIGSSLNFNLSHSGDWAVLAVNRSGVVGIDIEVASNTRDLSGIAENYYHPHEFSRLQKMESGEQCEYFYRLWTLKEAFLKALGTGISAGLDNIQFDLREGEIAAQIAAGFAGADDEWHFHQWELTAQVYCAIAYKNSKPLVVKWFDALLTPAFS